jgi:hypothetical protein
MITQHWETVWTFSTARYRVELAVTDETDAPEDFLEFPEDIAFARDGGWHWFTARVRVVAVCNEIELGSDYLGGCSYHDLDDFIRPVPHGYFRDMVREAIRQTRNHLWQLCKLCQPCQPPVRSH